MAAPARTARISGEDHLRGGAHGSLTLTVLIAAHNEEQSIGATLDSVAAQTRPPDRVVVAADNCTDDTVAVVRRHARTSRMRVTVFETMDNRDRKPGALNQAWVISHDSTDLFICIDADTVLPPNALADWEAEFVVFPEVAGCSAKFTMLSAQEMGDLAQEGWLPKSSGELPPQNLRQRMWCRMQKAEFSKWTDTALSRKGRWTSVLAGTACAIRASALEKVVAQRVDEGQPGLPWTTGSAVEDFELTYRLRMLGYTCRVSATVRAYTGAMLSLRTLWAQRLKWQVGTAKDLMALAINKTTIIDWWQQFLGLLSALLRITWIGLLIFGLAVGGHVHVLHYWWVFPAIFIVCDLCEAWRIPHRTWADLLTAAVLIPQELFAWLRAAWFTWSWIEVLTGRTHDRWALQIAAEGGSQ